MSTPTERAEARRKAILSRRGDRLAKLTSSARGEDAPAFMHDDPPLAPLPRTNNLEQFVGEEPFLSTPSAASTRNASPSPFGDLGLPPASADPSMFSEEQQARLLNALMAGAAARSSGQTAQSPAVEGSAPAPEGNPLAALMAMMGPEGMKDGTGGPPGMVPPNLSNLFAQPPVPSSPAKRTFLQKILPLIHLLAGWILLAFFIFWKEPQAYEAKPHATNSLDSNWRRWAELGWQSPHDAWGVQFVPFFWAFTTLTLVLHTWRIFNGLDPVQPHMLVSLALPHLPAPLPALILNGMKYWQIGSVFLDDIAVLLFGIGLIIWLSSWIVN